MQLRSASIALAGSIILAACSDHAPLAPSANPAAAKVAAAAAARTYLVEFNADDVPGGFAKQVAALGGTVALGNGARGAELRVRVPLEIVYRGARSSIKW